MVLPVTPECNQDHRTSGALHATFRQMTLSVFVGPMKTCGCAFSRISPAQCLPLRLVFSRFAQALCCLFLLVGSLFAANHPTVTGQNANCALCHADMTQGASVHSQGELACGLCHSSRPDGNAVEMLLTVPKEQLCFTCHERAAMQQHVSSSTEKDCLVCHDAHRSARAMLLRRNIGMDYARSSPPAASSKHAGTAAKAKSHAPGKRHLRQHPQPTDHEM